MYIVGSLVGIDRLEVDHVPDHANSSAMALPPNMAPAVRGRGIYV
jgi:hypothetical protein